MSKILLGLLIVSVLVCGFCFGVSIDKEPEVVYETVTVDRFVEVIKEVQVIVEVIKEVEVVKTIYVSVEVEPDILFPDYPISGQQAISILEYAVGIHQYYIDHPEYCNAKTGSISWHQSWIRKYSQIIDLIYSLIKDCGNG